MRAYLHDGQEPCQLHPKAGCIEARPNYSILTDFSCNAPPVHTSGSTGSVYSDATEKIITGAVSRMVAEESVGRAQTMAREQQDERPLSTPWPLSSAATQRNSRRRTELLIRSPHRRGRVPLMVRSALSSSRFSD